MDSGGGAGQRGVDCGHEARDSFDCGGGVGRVWVNHLHPRQALHQHLEYEVCKDCKNTDAICDVDTRVGIALQTLIQPLMNL